jgi:sortase A
MKKHLSSIILISVFLIGLSLLLYPSVSNYWNSFHSSKAIAGYAEEARNLDQEKYQQMWNDAVAFNATLQTNANKYRLTDEQTAAYYNLLDVGKTGIMGYIEIPSLDVELPIYHGTSDAVLQIAVGHLEWTSLPTGGKGTHCVLSGHRGLPSAKLFTHLDKLSEGDVFMLRILDEVLTYEVDQILIVKPHKAEDLHIVSGEDYCTLVTCTPYGVNSHRLLVRGHRIENEVAAKIIHVTSDAVQIEPVLVAPALAAPLLLILFISVLLPKRRSR